MSEQDTSTVGDAGTDDTSDAVEGSDDTGSDDTGSDDTSDAVAGSDDTGTDDTGDGTVEAAGPATSGSAATERANAQDGGTGGEAAPAASRTSRRLEDEGEVAADYLEELLDIADLDGDIDIDVENGRAAVSVVADEGSERQLRRLAGPQGEVLEALQELTRLAVQAKTGERSRLMLDVAGFRAGRRRELERLTERAVREVERTGDPVPLDPMTPFERKVVHDAVAAAGLRSDSDGVEPHRRVVIHPRA